MIIHLQFGFSQFISFRAKDLWNFSQSEHCIGPGSHVEYPTGTKNRGFVEDHPWNIPAKFGSNWPSGFGEETWNVKSLQTTDDGHQVMVIVHMDLWSRWAKNKKNYAWQAISTLNEDLGLSRLFWGVVVFRHHVIIGIEMLSKWRHPSIVDRILKSISFPYPT